MRFTTEKKECGQGRKGKIQVHGHWVMGAILFCSAGALPLVAQAQPEPPTQGQTRRPTPKSKKVASGKDAGIHVHGHWVLEIRNPDGSVDSRHEFENSIVPGGPVPPQACCGAGQGLLVSLLAGTFLNGGTALPSWQIYLTYTSSPICNSVAGCPQTYIGICPTAATTGYCATALTVQAATGGTQLVLQGTSPPSPLSGTIGQVGTNVYTCQPGDSGCASGSFYLWMFTQANVTVNVQALQTINVTVTISFS